ncbi:Rtf2 RING-finger-domain-containing protein [Scheffersomyces amazonensis]|uniref:Rtf2 RING-finger-domain-containing protein n=1 Tax=Scheffersomyces amazonensis TaxID=1078765 RepID=UPI00315D3C8C
MGNDGGTIAKRQDILSLHSSLRNLESRQELLNENESTLLTTCAISSLPLYSTKGHIVPIVGDYKGKLYIKEKILEYIIKRKIDKSLPNPAFAHINSLKDLIDVTIQWIYQDGVWIIQCPVTKESKASKATYAYLRPCGCVMSNKVLEEISKTSSKELPYESLCPVCDKLFNFNYDIVIINPLNNEKSSKFNETNYRYISEVLGLTHSKDIKKKKSKSKSVNKRKLQEVDESEAKKSKSHA